MATRNTTDGDHNKPCKVPKVCSASGKEPRPSKPVLESHLDLLIHGTFSDVVFIVGEEKERIPCHQLFLKARSSVFEVMFSERWNQDTNKEIRLEDLDPEIFKKMLKFMYTDSLDANVSEALELLQVAHKYDIKLLVSKCAKLLMYKVELDDSVAVFQTARKYEEIQLMDKVGDMWAESLVKLQSLPIFNQLDSETLMYILKRNDLKMREVDIFRLALQWAGNQMDATLQQNLEYILPLIRFPTMTLNEFTTIVIPTKVLPGSTVNELLKYFGTDDDAAKNALLAKALGFSIQHRQPKNSIVYVELYQEDPIDVVNGMTTPQMQTLKESLQFHKEFKVHDDHAQPIQEIGLSGITFYCPFRAVSTFKRASPIACFRAFKVCLKSKYFRHITYDLSSSHSYTILLSLPNVQLKEGKKTDIKLDTVVPLQKNRIYCITVEEEPPDGTVQGYQAKLFNPFPILSVEVNVGNSGPTRISCERSQLEGFKKDKKEQFHLQLIHRLGFEEFK